MQTPDLHLELRPTARMAPWTLQALHLLELGTADLSDFVEAALLENPLLEREEHPFESTYAATGVHYEDGPLPEPAGEEGDRLDTLPAILLEQLEAPCRSRWRRSAPIWWSCWTTTATCRRRICAT